MNGDSIALDTNIAIQVLNDVAITIHFLNGFPELCLPIPVLGELRYGALNSARVPQNLQRVDALLSRCRFLGTDAQTAERYAALRFELKQIGNPIPENDLWIAAICVQHNLALATADHHFADVQGLRIAWPTES